MDLKITNELKHFSSTPDIDFTKGSVKNNPAEENTRLKKAAQDFESLFTSMMMKSMSETTEGLFGDESFGGDFYNSIFQNEISSEISKGKGIGIADFIYKKLESLNSLKNNENKMNDLNPVKLQNKINTEEQIKIKNELKDSPVLKPGKDSLKRLNMMYFNGN